MHQDGQEGQDHGLPMLQEQELRFQSITALILRNRGQYQLLVISCLYISVKVQGQVVFSSEDFATISQGAYLASDSED